MPNQKIVTETALSALASDIKTALSGKANSNDVYTKTEIDNALELKADKSELYNVYPTEQESGAIAHFTDGADNIPVKSLVSEIVVVESGSGEKSPTNPYTISGWSEGLLAVTDNTDLQYISGLLKGTYDCADLTSLTWTYNSGNGFLNCTTDLPNAIQSFSGVPNAISGVDLPLVNASQLGDVEKGWTIYNRRMYLKNTALSEAELRSLLVGNYVIYKTVSTIQPTVTKSTLDGVLTSFGINGNTYEFTFGQTVYGGHFDNKGNFVVTYKIVDFGDLTWTYYGGRFYSSALTDIGGEVESFYYKNTISSCYEKSTSQSNNTYFIYSTNNIIYVYDNAYTDGGQFKTARTGQKIVYELANPITLAITSQDIPTLLGENNIFSNCGDVEVNYYADIGLYIDKKISSLAQA